MSEHAEQQLLFEWAKLHEAKHPELAMLFAVPNGGFRHWTTAVMLKAEGVKAGVPDVWLPVRRGGYSGLVIEMKAQGGRLEPSQREWLTLLAINGWCCNVCYCFEIARAVLERYLSLFENSTLTLSNSFHIWKTEAEFDLDKI